LVPAQVEQIGQVVHSKVGKAAKTPSKSAKFGRAKSGKSAKSGGGSESSEEGNSEDDGRHPHDEGYYSSYDRAPTNDNKYM